MCFSPAMFKYMDAGIEVEDVHRKLVLPDQLEEEV